MVIVCHLTSMEEGQIYITKQIRTMLNPSLLSRSELQITEKHALRRKDNADCRGKP